MKYTSTIKSEQTIQIGENKSVKLVPGKGELSKDEALAVAKSPWGKRLIETGYLTFAEKIEVKDEKVERGMTIKPGEKKGEKKGKGKPSPSPKQGDGEGAGDGGDETASTSDEGAGNEGSGDSSNEGNEGAGSEADENEIPNFEINEQGGGNGNGEE